MRAAARHEGDVARDTLLPLAWVAGWLAYLAQNKGYGYHLGPCFAVMVGLLCTGLGALTARLRASPALLPPLRALALVLLAVPLLGTGVKLARAVERTSAWLSDAGENRAYYAGFPAGDDMSIADALALLSQVMQIYDDA